MLFRPSINSKISIDGKEYFFTEHPAAKGMPYGQTGRRATVYQVRNGNEFHALKVFTKAFRTEQTEVSARRIQAYANLPGLQVCSRVVITRQNNGTAVGQYPDLEYAVLMTWVKGQTWQEILLAHQPLTRTQSLEIAHNFAQILAAMEERQIAHCDLSGPNILLDDTTVNLVDVEDLYAPTLEKPEKLPGGSTGYGHKTSVQGLWNADADRFAGAILLAEMLGWHDERARRVAVGEQYFDASELQSPCDRYQILLSALKAHHGAFADLFAQAWFSKSLNDCPRLADWLTIMGNGNVSSPQPETPKPAELTDAVRYLFDSFNAKIAENNFAEAEKLVNAIRALATDFDEPVHTLAQARKNAEKERAKREELARLEQELGGKCTVIQNIQAEIGKLQAELREHEQTRSKIENTIRQLQIAPTVSSQVQQDVVTSTRLIAPNPETPAASPKAPLSISMPSSFPSYGKVSARVSQNCYVKCMPVPGQSSFFAFQKRFVTISKDKMLQVWNMNTEQVSEQWITFDQVKYVCKNSKSTLAALGSSSGDLVLVEAGGKYLDKVRLMNNINGIVFCEDSLLFVATDNGLMSIDIRQGDKNKMIFPGFSAWYVTMSNDGYYIALSSKTGDIKLFSTRDYSIVGEGCVPGNPILRFTTDSRFLVYGDSGGIIKLLRVPSLDVLVEYSHTKYSVTCLAFSDDNKILATGFKNGDICLWSTEYGKLLDATGIHTDEVSSLDFHSSGKYLLSSSYDGRAILWDIIK